jgi:hypothetical protein
MRVWGSTDPRLLCRKHLLGEHQEVHALISTIINRKGWIHHPECKRFDSELLFPQLLLRHELIRCAMAQRFGAHHITEHATPIAQELPLPQLRTLALYSIMLRRPVDNNVFIDLVFSDGFPPTTLEHDTPWQRDSVSQEWYADHFADWSWQLVTDFHGGPPPVGFTYHGSKIPA